MFILKQFLKLLALPPMLWLLPLLAVLVFWHRSWARKLLLLTVLLILALHSGVVARALRYPLESRYAPVRDPSQVPAYDAIVVLTSAAHPAKGLIPFPTLDEYMFRRLDEALRLYRLRPVPVIVSGGHVDPFTPDQQENRIARDFLLRWGVPPEAVIGEDRSRDTFESALEVRTILMREGWKRYLLVTSAAHMPRSMLVFEAGAPEPIPAPGDFTVSDWEIGPFDFFPSVSAARSTYFAIHEYAGLANYYWRLHGWD